MIQAWSGSLAPFRSQDQAKHPCRTTCRGQPWKRVHSLGSPGEQPGNLLAPSSVKLETTKDQLGHRISQLCKVLPSFMCLSHTLMKLKMDSIGQIFYIQDILVFSRFEDTGPLLMLLLVTILQSYTGFIFAMSGFNILTDPCLLYVPFHVKATSTLIHNKAGWKDINKGKVLPSSSSSLAYSHLDATWMSLHARKSWHN